MKSKRPRIVVFYGGSAGNHDLSAETGYWMCQYIPRSKYDITPVRVMPDGTWKVPLGSLPRSGPIGRTMSMLTEAVRALPPAQALERLLARPIASMLTVVRGKGGDDGSLHSLGQALGVPVIGSPYATCQQTSNKHLFNQAISEIANTPHTHRFRSSENPEEIIDQIREEFLPPLFIKPIDEEGSHGIEHVENVDDLASAVKKATMNHTILLQEKLAGAELSVTLVEDARGNVLALPPTVITTKRAPFYDALAKRRPGRAVLHTPSTNDNPVIAEASAIAHEIYDELGCRGIVTVDMIIGDGMVDVLEVNTIPTFSELTPLKHQLKTGGLHPATLFDNLIARSLSN